MKLSENTLTVLKNFSAINSGVVLRSGKVQKTIAPKKEIMLEATLEDDLPIDFGIYDLNQFLGNVTTLNNPELTFDKDYIIMDDGELSLTYHACQANLIITPPDKELILKNPDVKFSISNASLQKLLKLAAMNSLPNLSVIGENAEINLKIHEKANDTSNYGTIKIADYAGKDFVASFKTEYLKFIPDDYDVEVKSGEFAKFVNKTGNLKYFAALESK